MADLRIENRTLTDSPDTAPQRAFVYQHIHVCDLRPHDLPAHLSVAAAAAREVFGIDFRPDPRETDSLCRRMLLANRYPQELSACIEMRLGDDGTASYRCGEIFPYKGLQFNAVRPEAVAICCEVPFGGLPTSARLAAHYVAMAAVRRSGARAVAMCDAAGRLVSVCDSPAFAVFGRRIVTPPARPSVERDRVAAAAARAGYELTEAPVERDELRRADELFFSDCRGITALSRCDGRTYADIIARRVAEKIKIQNSEFSAFPLTSAEKY